MAQIDIRIENQSGVLVVDSRLIAQRLDIEHESLMRNLKKFQAKIERRFGAIRFEFGLRNDGNGGGKQPVYALLTEPQATALMTLSRNTDEVVECKLDLVEAFDRAKVGLSSKDSISITPAALTQQAIEEAEISVDWLTRTLGIDETVGKQIMVDMVAKQRPHLKESLESIKKLIGASKPLESHGLTPTEISERLRLADRLHTRLGEAVNAKTVNNALEALGLQERGTRQSTKTGKDKHFWQLTEAGKKYGHVYLTTGGNNWSGGQIRWQESVVRLVEVHLTGEADLN